MAQNWSSEDFAGVARVPSADKDFWEPALHATEAIRRSTSVKNGVSIGSPPAAVTEPIELVDNAPDNWDFTDFDGTQRHSAHLIDPWEYYPTPIATPPAAVEADSDFWNPTPSIARPSIIPSGTGDWSENISLPRYDPFASEKPFYAYFRDTPESLAEKRARWLLSLLGITNTARHRFSFHTFTELFLEYPHHSTFRALSDLALDDATVDELISAFILKQIWNESPIFSSVRTKRRDIFVASKQTSLLGWTLALRLVRQSRGVPPEQIIDPDWFNDWLVIPYADPLYWRFIDYVCARIDSIESGALAAPPTTRRFVLPLTEVGIDGFSPINNFSRTSSLIRTSADCFEFSSVEQTGHNSSKT